MQTFIQTGRQRVSLHTLGVRVMLLTDDPDSRTGKRLADYGSVVDVVVELEDAVAAILDDPFGYDLFVMECDGFGGISGAEQAVSSLIAGDASSTCRPILWGAGRQFACRKMCRMQAFGSVSITCCATGPR